MALVYNDDFLHNIFIGHLNVAICQNIMTFKMYLIHTNNLGAY